MDLRWSESFLRYLLSRSERSIFSSIFLDSSNSATRLPNTCKIYRIGKVRGRLLSVKGDNSLEIEGESGQEGAEGLEEELAVERKKNQELLNRLKYMQADLENYRKRVDREMREAGESSLRSLVSRLLVVQDELELAAKHAGAKDRHGELVEGIGMV